MSNDGVSDAEKKLWDELWGCVNYLKIPFDTIMTMPVYIRKFWILKHNEATSQENSQSKGGSSVVDGQSINAYAQIEQGNRNTPK
jgi:hypothetical protein